MPKPMHRSSSFRKVRKVTRKGVNVTRFTRRKNSFPHCSICNQELNGISIKKNAKGKSRKSNSRIFGGVLCAKCTANVIKLGSRIENGEMKLNDIGMKQRQFVLQTISH